MYSKIFEEIIEIVHRDYAGCIDKEGWDQPEKYRQTIRNFEEKDSLSDIQFVQLVQDYLLDLKDAHVVFRLSSTEQKQSLSVGFTVRRYEDRLYVTSVQEEDRLQKGVAIAELDGIGIPELIQSHGRQLVESIAEREKWDAVLLQFKEAHVVDHEGNSIHLRLNYFPKKPLGSTYEMKNLDSQTNLLTLTDFMDLNAVSGIIDKHQRELGEIDHLIIDVRVNRGGSDTAFLELLPYLFEGDTVNLNDDNETMLTNCTERNVELRVEMMQAALHSVEDIPTQKIIDTFIHELEQNKGKGFVELDLSAFETELTFQTRPGPKKVIVLTDVFCGSSGDSFVEICKKSSKVTILGRPTAGLNDYANLAHIKWNSTFELWYPTSRDGRINKGRSMSGKGIAPDIYIPWTPQHIKEDVDLQEALRILRTQVV